MHETFETRVYLAKINIKPVRVCKSQCSFAAFHIFFKCDVYFMTCVFLNDNIVYGDMLSIVLFDTYAALLGSVFVVIS